MRPGLAFNRTLVLGLAALALAGCGGNSPDRTPSTPAPVARPTPPPQRVRCPGDAPPHCRSAIGRVLYVEAVDPDGDGDAHFVLGTAHGISAPGLTSIDVERELRPRRLPYVGDWVTAAGPVYRGSYGQRQIQAVRLRIRRLR